MAALYPNGKHIYQPKLFKDNRCIGNLKRRSMMMGLIYDAYIFIGLPIITKMKNSSFAAGP